MADPLVLGFVLAGLFADAVGRPEPREPIDRIAAVVGEKPIFLSEVRRRVRPHFYRIDFMGGDPKDRDAAKRTAMREMVERMIDEQLEAADAEKTHISTDDAEIDGGIKQVLAQAKLSKDDLLAEVKKQGMTETEYRDEIRRQIIEGKLVQLRVRVRIKVGEPEARAVYATWVKEQTGENAPIDVRMVAVQIPSGANADVQKAKETLATQIAAQAKSGTDFCTLVTKHTDDAATKNTCGSRGPMARAMLLADIAKAVAPLKPGETAGPILFTDPAGSKAYLVMQRAPGAAKPPPAFEKVKDQMTERAYREATERERKKWLEELRKGTYIEVKQ
jgi:peptidyl-prolyl cis-trans isomerase SurA